MNCPIMLDARRAIFLVDIIQQSSQREREKNKTEGAAENVFNYRRRIK
jgi:hypothetical protein